MGKRFEPFRPHLLILQNSFSASDSRETFGETSYIKIDLILLFVIEILKTATKKVKVEVEVEIRQSMNMSITKPIFSKIHANLAKLKLHLLLLFITTL